MSDTERRFHEQWLGMAQPAEGLVVSVPVLADAQCMEKLPREAHVTFLQHVVEGSRDENTSAQRIDNLFAVLDSVLELDASRFDEEAALPKDVSLYVPEGKQLLRPTRAMKWPTAPMVELGADATPAAVAAKPYAMLVWEVPPAVTELDKPETATGSWEYPAQAKFERLLRECRVPIGLLSNGWELRLVYAPHGESSGWLAFRVDDMASVSGRPIFDAFVMLLGRQRWFGVAPEHQLPSILADSRKRNADVTNALSGQVFEALEVLLAGFAAADERDGSGLLREALESDDQDLYAGLLAVLLRMVFLLYCEDRALLPVEHPLFGDNYSLLGLFDQLQGDNGKYPDTMHRRFGAYPQLVSLFRAVFLGVKHGDLDIPARRGDLFDPNTYPFLEGWGPEGSAPITQQDERAAVKVPSVDDCTVFTVLHKLLYLDGQRLSYKALDVEQIGSVYEALMGFDVLRLTSGAVRIKAGNKKGAARVWVEAEPLLQIGKAQRQRWLQDELGFDKATADNAAKAVASAKTPEEALTALESLGGRRPERAPMGRLVVQPGPERRRTSSHYTPRTLTEPIVKRTLDPLIKSIGDEPPSETLLQLVICDPAMGSGAFLVAACRYLADHVVAAWTREGKMEVIADAHEDVVNHARRLVAQRCLYGVDKNRYAVQLARLSLWLVTMARNEPFTFVDHALRHGDSLVGLDFDQIKAFHWKAGNQVELSSAVLKEALDEAIDIRRRIQELAAEGTWAAQREKERLLYDANDALDRVRLIGDLVIGAFFAGATDKARQKARDERLRLVELWLAADNADDTATASELEMKLRALQAELRRTQVPFHWMVEFPEVFYGGRPDPLDGGRTNGAAWVDAFVGNPPYSGGTKLSSSLGTPYVEWLRSSTEATTGNVDLSVFFLRRCASLVGMTGGLGFVTTSSIVSGDNTVAGLAYIRGDGWRMVSSGDARQWPGSGASVAYLEFVAFRPSCDLAEPHVIRGDRPSVLGSNMEIACSGCDVFGAGFILSAEEYEAWKTSHVESLPVVFRYIGAAEFNQSPSLTASRYIINFGELDRASAQRYTAAFGRVSELVYPARQTVKQRDRRELWWLFATRAPRVAAFLNTRGRCLVVGQLSKHLAFGFLDAGQVIAHTLIVILLDHWTAFSILQSRVHRAWAQRWGSAMRTDTRYTNAACFETFPFPAPDPRRPLPSLEHAGESLYRLRAAFMQRTQQGLTQAYNLMSSADATDQETSMLRTAHEAVDRAVLDAYGWTDVVVPAYCPRTDADHEALKTFENTVIDRLFALNERRAAEEQAASPTTNGKKTSKKTVTKRAKKSAPTSSPQDTLPGLECSDG